MKRYKQIDILRAIAIIMVAMYHFWVVSEYQTTGITLLNRFLTYGGEIGVTIFFVISGFSIYYSLYQQEKRGEEIKFLPFIKKRWKRIYPSYFICIWIVLLIGDGAVYISEQNIRSIVFHLLLIHNFFLSTHGSISGVLWTMGVIFQFYLISIFLYRCINKRWVETLIFSIIFGILIKYFLYSFFAENELSSSYYFIYGRQLFSALDNFIIGMCIARRVLNKKENIKLVYIYFTIIMFFIWILYVTPKGVIYSNTFFGYTWHSITAILIGVCIWQILMFENKKEGILEKGLLFIGKYEYEIYIWHLLIANNLYAKSTLVQEIARKGYWGFSIFMMILAVWAGWIFNKMADSLTGVSLKMGVVFIKNQIKKICKFNVRKELSYTEIGMVLLLLLLLVSSITTTITTIYKKDFIEYSLKREDTQEIEIINKEYEFSIIPVAAKLNKYIIFVQQEILPEVSGEILYEIIDNETQELVCSGNINVESIQENKTIELTLLDYEMEDNREYSLKLYPKIIGSIFVTVDKDNQLYHKQIFENTYHNWYLSVVIIISLCFIGLILLLVKIKKYLYRFVALSMFIGIIGIVVYPPYTAPDELRHFARAYTISEGVVVCKTYGSGEKYYNQKLAECNIEKEIVDLKLISASSGEQWESETNSRIFLPKYLENIKKEISNEKLIIPYHGTSGINPIAYLPQIVFIWIARLLHCNVLGIYYMARLGNLICSTILLGLAIKQSPKYQHLFSILFFSPGLVFLRSTCSTDSFLFSLVALFIACVMKVVETESLFFFQKKIYGKLVMILAAIALIKLPYILCALSLICINNKKFSLKKYKNKWEIWLKRVVYIFSLIIVPSIIYLLSNRWLLSYTTKENKVGSLILYVCMNLVEFINIISQTFFGTFANYLSSALTFQYSQVLLIPYLLVLGYFGLCQKREEKRIEKSWLIFLGLGMWGVILGVFYSTTLGSIQGVQGRYILPILLIIGIGISSYKDTEEFERRMYGNRYDYYMVLILWIHMIITFKSYWIE